jgi:hypothetical protein
MKLLLVLSILIWVDCISAQVAISTDGTSPHASAMLHIKGTDKGILIPRMLSSQRMAITSPAVGLLVYDVDTQGFWFFDGISWQTIIGSNINDQISDADNDTGIQVEESPDEDVIRFDVAGIERWTIFTTSPSVRMR